MGNKCVKEENMRIIKVLEHNGKLYREGDLVKITYDNDCSDKGIIKYFGEATDTETNRTDDYIEFGKYMEKLSNIISIKDMVNSNAIVLRGNNPCVVTKINKASNHFIFKNFKVGTRFFMGLCIWTTSIPFTKSMKMIVYKENSFDEIETCCLEDEDLQEFKNFEYEEIEWDLPDIR